MKIIVFDTEATDLTPGQICQLSYLIVEDGRVIAVGSHESLLSTCPAYARMVELQRLEDEARE